MKLRKRKSDMTSSERFSLAGENRLREFIGRRILSPGVFFFEGDYLPVYEEIYLSLPFQRENGKKRDRSKDHQENTLRISEVDTLIGQRRKMRENCMKKKSVSGWGRGPHPLPF
jgi:hypothetical protein